MIPMFVFFPGLSKRTTSEGLREAFVKHGEVVHGMFLLILMHTNYDKNTV